MIRSWIARAVILGLAAWLVGRVTAAEPFATQSVEQLHTLIKPAQDEDSWARIPWRTSLWEARQQAAAQGKPILLWEMDGHPLGCT